MPPVPPTPSAHAPLRLEAEDGREIQEVSEFCHRLAHAHSLSMQVGSTTERHTISQTARIPVYVSYTRRYGISGLGSRS